MSIPQVTINTRNKVVTFNFPDTTYTLESFKKAGTKLIAYFSYENTCGRRERYSNSFSLDVFNIGGTISSVELKQLSSATSNHS